MSERITAVLDQIEAEQQSQSIPDGVGALRLLQMVYRGEVRATPQQMRAAIESLPYEQPRLSAVAVGYLTGETFAERLDRAIERSAAARPIKLIEARAINADDNG
jgi:hypothetical protein